MVAFVALVPLLAGIFYAAEKTDLPPPKISS